jgi:hypothetical protein
MRTPKRCAIALAISAARKESPPISRKSACDPGALDYVGPDRPDRDLKRFIRRRARVRRGHRAAIDRYVAQNQGEGEPVAQEGVECLGLKTSGKAFNGDHGTPELPGSSLTSRTDATSG